MAGSHLTVAAAVSPSAPGPALASPASPPPNTTTNTTNTTTTPPARPRTTSRLPAPTTAVHEPTPTVHEPACACTCDPEPLRPARWHFDVDDYVNPVLPPSPLRRLPPLVSRFFGYRREPAPPVGNLLATVWTFVGVFAAVAAAGATLGHLPAVQDTYHRNIVHAEPARNPVFSVGIFGAAAVLEFYALDSPYAQPRSVLGGQLVSSVVGVSVAKLAAAADGDAVRRASRRWLQGALSTAFATCFMALTGTVHPPGGATALLAVTDNGALSVGWWLVPGVLVGSVVMQAVALVINNIQRRYPLYWWTPEETGQLWKRGWRRWRGKKNKSRHQGKEVDLEAKAGKPCPDDDDDSGSSPDRQRDTPDTLVGDTPGDTDDTDDTDDSDPGLYPITRRTSTRSSQAASLERTTSKGPTIVIRRNKVLVPDTLDLTADEIRFLETLSERL